MTADDLLAAARRLAEFAGDTAWQMGDGEPAELQAIAAAVEAGSRALARAELLVHAGQRPVRSWCGRDTLIPIAPIPEHVDRNALIITFDLDGEDVLAPTGGMLVWADMDTAPVKGDLIVRRTLGLDEDGVVRVKARAWFEHNWLLIYLDRVELEDAEPTAEVEREAVHS